MYGCEAWTITKEIQRKIEAAEMWFFRPMLIVPWTARKTTEEVLKETETTGSLMNRIRRRQAKETEQAVPLFVLDKVIPSQKNHETEHPGFPITFSDLVQATTYTVHLVT
ncbi:retrovirus-related Pol polyprotein LINE-1 [Elysia marginata]|uniref:Retrovirus-related Pol polyprotein LINE-1 n=1 Tax=Elysia marginata TaxID=1093978 RepID=A0AAV4F1C6_9GAST|nr:retrovirus-related Pol polyprotein LINE-1 [Elysia marginata]